MALLRHDVGRGALLLERLGPSLCEQGIPLAQRHEILSRDGTTGLAPCLEPVAGQMLATVDRLANRA